MKRKHAVGLVAIAGAAVATRSALRGRYSFRDKSVVITGGSRGLGLELARLFAEEGARITLIARTAETLEQARVELKDAGAEALAIACDVRDRKQAQDAIARVMRHFGAID